MKIAIISDSHDNIWNLRKALQRFKELKIDSIIHCGDLCAPFMISELETAQVPVHIVFGNADDRHPIALTCEKSKLATLYGNLGEVIFDSKKIAFTHFPHSARPLVQTGKYDAVFHGHTHEKYSENIDGALIANPGEIIGNKNEPSFAVYDTVSGEIDFFGI